MRSIWNFVKVTLLGGLLFLLPFAVALVIAVKVEEIALRAVDPLVKLLPFQKAVAVAIIYFGGAILLIALCFIVGLIVARLNSRTIATWLEDKIMAVFPPYAALRTVGQNVAGMADDETLRAVLVRNGEDWEVGFKFEDGKTADYHSIFMPGSPSPWSGVVKIVAAENIRPFDVGVGQVLQCLKQSGRGLSDLIKADTLKIKT